MNSGDQDNPITWQIRRDLTFHPHEAGGWIVKDPLTQRYTWLDDPEYQILRMLDGRITRGEVLRRSAQIFPDRQLDKTDIDDFLLILSGQELIRRTVPGDSVRMNASRREASLMRVMQPLMKLLRFKVRLLNPSRLLDSLLPLVRWLLNPVTAWASGFLGLVALVIVMLRFDDVMAGVQQLHRFLGPRDVAVMLLIFVVVKCLHEAGHAFVSRIFGAECNECGLMLLVFTPVLYTNVTDVWMLKQRQRLLVTAAGMLVELFIASVCVVLWSLAATGVTESLLLNTVIVCSVSTILFNGNPLLRFDGYHLLADWIGIPNLARQSSAVVRRTALQLVSGCVDDTMDVRPRRYWFLLTYGVMALIYRLILTLAILKLIDVLSREWNVQVLGAAMSLILLTGFLLLPGSGFLLSLLGKQRRRQYPIRIWCRIAISGLIVVAVFFLPLPHSVVAPAQVLPRGTAIYVNQPGNIRPAIRYGESVSDRTLAVLDNAEVLRQRQVFQADTELLKIRLQTLLSNPNTAGSDAVPTVRELLKASQHRFTRFDREVQMLNVKSPVTGTLFPPPATSSTSRSDLPGFWHGTPLNSKNDGAYLERGTLLGYVGSDVQRSVIAFVAEDEIGFVQPGQRLEFRSVCDGLPVQSGVVSEVSQLKADSVPEAFVSAGLINAESASGLYVPTANLFQLTVVLDPTSQLCVPLYSTGRIRIHTVRQSVASRIWRYLRQTFAHGI